MSDLERAALGAAAVLLTAIHDDTSDANVRYKASSALRSLGLSVESDPIASSTDDAPTGT